MITPATTTVATEPRVAQRHQRLAWLGGGAVEVLLDAASTAGQLSVLRNEMHRGDSAPLHVHAREDEVFVILQGTVTFWSGEERHQLSNGGVVYLPRGLPHTYRVDSAQADVLTLCTPGGFEGFFRSAGHDLATPVPPEWTLGPSQLEAAFAAHGGTFVGPPKSLDD